MKRKQALAERIAQLEAGENPSQAQWAEVFPDTPDDDGYPRSMMATQANVGWIDAAKLLHVAVLPRHYAQVHMWPVPEMCRVDIGGGHTGRGDDPARAWLLAILRALHSMEPET